MLGKKITIETIEIDKVLPIVSRKLMTAITARTPIDTGAARAHWEFRRGSSKEFIINNPLPYIQRLDQGWSRQAPAPLGIIKFVAQRFKNIVDESVRDWVR